MAAETAADRARRWRALLPALPDAAPAVFEELLAELMRWNRRIRLTAEASIEDLALRVVDDSLVLAPFVRGPSLVDVGSGPGIPALPLAVALPDLEVRAVEAIAKKSAFSRAFSALHPALRVRVFTGRAGAAPGPWGTAATAVSRAFAAPPAWIAVGAPLVAPGGRLLVLLGAADPAAAAVEADPAARARGLVPAGSWCGHVGAARRGLLLYDRPRESRADKLREP